MTKEEFRRLAQSGLKASGRGNRLESSEAGNACRGVPGAMDYRA